MRKNIKNAKKIVLLFSSVLMLGSLAFTGCKGKNNDQKAASDQTKQTQNAVPSTTTDKESKTASNDSVLNGGSDSSLDANKDKAGTMLSDSKNTTKPIDDKNSFDTKKDEKKDDKKDNKKDEKKDNKKDDKKKDTKKQDTKNAKEVSKLADAAKQKAAQAADKAKENVKAS